MAYLTNFIIELLLKRISRSFRMDPRIKKNKNTFIFNNAGTLDNSINLG